jgi:hypothetical protein
MAQTIRTTKSAFLFPSLKFDAAASALSFLFIFLLAAFSLLQASPPAAMSVNAPLTEFSSGRAMKHLERIAQKPHALGSAEHDAVRDYIREQISAVGLEPQVQEATGINRYRDWILQAGNVQNVIARLPGTGSGKAILLVGHYDTKPYAAGASDDGAAVAAILETMRILKAGQPLKNDVIFLFSDGEEGGLLGASAFVEEHPWAKDVGIVLNFEARGSRGPSIMFETSNGNDWLIAGLAKAATYPVANSLSYEVYKRMPNDTDFTVFRRHGMPGLNFAYIEGLPSYHTELDNLQQIDERSLQHHGMYALALTRHFGELDLGDTGKGNAIYFDLLGRMLVHYPAWLAMYLNVVVFVVFAGLLLQGLRKKILTLAGVVLGFFAFLLSSITSAVVVRLIWATIFRLRYVSEARPQGETYNSDLYLLSFVILAFAIAAALYQLFHKKISAENLAVGALLWWLILATITSIYVPGASYLFTWPLLFSLIGLGGQQLVREREFPFSISLVFLLLGAIPGIILWTPLIYHVFIGLTLNSIGTVMLMVVLVLGLLIPLLDILMRPKRWALPAAAGVLGVAVLLAAGVMSTFDAKHPKPNSIFYALNADTGEALWASMAPQPDKWTSQFLSASAQRKTLPDFFPRGVDDQFLQNEGRQAPLPAPVVELIQNTPNAEGRTLRFRIRSLRQAPVISIYIDSKTKVSKALLNGRQLEESNTAAIAESRDHLSMRFFGLPPEGLEFTAQIGSSEPVKIRVVDQSYDLPQIPQSFRARPNDMIPSSMPFTDSTLVSKSFTFQ